MINSNITAICSGLVLSIIALNSFAAAPLQGWYTTGFGGFASVPDNINITPSGDGLLRSNVSYSTGYDVGGAIGYKSGPIRYEGEVTYLNAAPNSFDLGGTLQTSVNGSTSVTAGMANIYYDFDSFTGSFVPYVGIGAGYAGIDIKLNSTSPTVANFSDSDGQFAYQGTAGISFNFSANVATTIAYRYLTTASNSNDFGKPYQANLGNLGIVYRFDQD